MPEEQEDGKTYPDDLDGFKQYARFPNPTLEDINKLEEENIRIPTLKYLAAKPSKKKAPFNFSWLLRLHKEMYGDVWDWAGQKRIRDTNIGVEWTLIDQQLGALVCNIPHMLENFTAQEAGMRIHHEAVKIHPFKNGNGRWSRLLANIWLKQNASGVIQWPSITGSSPIRDEYLEAVREGDRSNFSKLTDLHERYFVRD